MLWACDEDCVSMVLQTVKNRNVCCTLVTREVPQCTLAAYSPECFYNLQWVAGRSVLRRKFVDYEHYRAAIL